MSTINFLTPGFNKAGQNNIDNQGGVIGPENDPVINDLVTIFTSPGTFNRTKTEGTVLVVAGGGGAANRGGGAGAGGARIATSHPFPASGVPVTVGSGGAGDGPYPWSNGSGNGSAFGASSPISCTGGGRGGNRPYPPGQNSIPRGDGDPGGSGGGAARGFGGTPTKNGGSGITNEGNIGARRLHTVMSKLLNEILFDIPEKIGANAKVVITKKMVEEKLNSITENKDLSEYIL